MTCFQWKFHLANYPLLKLVVFSIIGSVRLASILLIEELYSCSLISYFSSNFKAVAPSIEVILLVSKLFVCENNPSE